MSTAEGADRQQSTTSPGPSGQYVSASEEVGRRMETIDVSRQQMSTVEIGRQHGRKLVNSEQLNAYTDEQVILQVSASEVDISRHQSTAKVVPSRQRTPESVEHGRKQKTEARGLTRKVNQRVEVPTPVSGRRQFVAVSNERRQRVHSVVNQKHAQLKVT